MFVTKRLGFGGIDLGQDLRTIFVSDGQIHTRFGAGRLTRSSSRLTAKITIFGVPLIMKAWFWSALLQSAEIAAQY